MGAPVTRLRNAFSLYRLLRHGGNPIGWSIKTAIRMTRK